MDFGLDPRVDRLFWSFRGHRKREEKPLPTLLGARNPPVTVERQDKARQQNEQKKEHFEAFALLKTGRGSPKYKLFEGYSP